MAVSVNTFNTWGQTSTSVGSVTTASVTTAAGQVYLLFRPAQDVTSVTSTANITWTQFNGWLWYGVANGASTGTITFNHNNGFNALYTMASFNGANTSGTIIRQAVRSSSGSGSSTFLRADMAAFGDANNASIGYFTNTGSGSWTVESGYTLVNSSARQMCEFKATSDTTISSNNSGLFDYNFQAYGVELVQGVVVVPKTFTFTNAGTSTHSFSLSKGRLPKDMAFSNEQTAAHTVALARSRPASFAVTETSGLSINAQKIKLLEFGFDETSGMTVAVRENKRFAFTNAQTSSRAASITKIKRMAFTNAATSTMVIPKLTKIKGFPFSVAATSTHQVHIMRPAVSTGYVSFTTPITLVGVGTAWNNPQNALANDSSSASVTLTGSSSDFLVFSLDDLGIPAGAKINDVQVRVNYSVPAGSITLKASIGSGTTFLSSTVGASALSASGSNQTANFPTTGIYQGVFNGAVSTGNHNKLKIWAEETGGFTRTVNLQYVSISVNYALELDAFGVETQGLTSFYTTPINIGNGTSSWTNPGNALVEDGLLATIAAGTTKKALGFKLSDLGLLTGTAITGFAVEIKFSSNMAYASSTIAAGVSLNANDSWVSEIRRKAGFSTLTKVTLGHKYDTWGMTAQELRGGAWNNNYYLAVYLDEASPYSSVNIDSVQIKVWQVDASLRSFTFNVAENSGWIERIGRNRQNVFTNNQTASITWADWLKLRSFGGSFDYASTMSSNVKRIRRTPFVVGETSTHVPVLKRGRVNTMLPIAESASYLLNPKRDRTYQSFLNEYAGFDFSKLIRGKVLTAAPISEVSSLTPNVKRNRNAGGFAINETSSFTASVKRLRESLLTLAEVSGVTFSSFIKIKSMSFGLNELDTFSFGNMRRLRKVIWGIDEIAHYIFESKGQKMFALTVAEVHALNAVALRMRDVRAAITELETKTTQLSRKQVVSATIAELSTAEWKLAKLKLFGALMEAGSTQAYAAKRARNCPVTVAEVNTMIANIGRARKCVVPIANTSNYTINLARLQQFVTQIAEQETISTMVFARLKPLIAEIAEMSDMTFDMVIRVADPDAFIIDVSWNEFVNVNGTMVLSEKKQTLSVKSKMTNNVNVAEDQLEAIVGPDDFSGFNKMRYNLATVVDLIVDIENP